MHTFPFSSSVCACARTPAVLLSNATHPSLCVHWFRFALAVCRPGCPILSSPLRSDSWLWGSYCPSAYAMPRTGLCFPDLLCMGTPQSRQTLPNPQIYATVYCFPLKDMEDIGLVFEFFENSMRSYLDLVTKYTFLVVLGWYRLWWSWGWRYSGFFVWVTDQHESDSLSLPLRRLSGV